MECASIYYPSHRGWFPASLDENRLSSDSFSGHSKVSMKTGQLQIVTHVFGLLDVFSASDPTARRGYELSGASIPACRCRTAAYELQSLTLCVTE